MPENPRHNPPVGSRASTVPTTSGSGQHKDVGLVKATRQADVRPLGSLSGESKIKVIQAPRPISAHGAATDPLRVSGSRSSQVGPSASARNLRVIVGRPFRFDPTGKNYMTSTTSGLIRLLHEKPVDAKQVK
jgi:hypothetical protein